MQITDDDVKIALAAYKACDDFEHECMRAALEAALGQFILQYGDNIELQEAEQIGFKRSTSCIEDLAAALRPFAQIEIGITDKEAVDMEDWFRHGGDSLTVGDFRRARVILEGWGLK